MLKRTRFALLGCENRQNNSQLMAFQLRITNSTANIYRVSFYTRKTSFNFRRIMLNSSMQIQIRLANY